MSPPIDSAIDELFTLEADALRAYRQADPAEFNALLERVSAISPDPAVRFGLTPRHGRLDEFEQAMFAEVDEAVHPRHVYKVSTYAEGGTDCYAVFVSAQNPPPQLFRLSEVYWLSADARVRAFHQREEGHDSPPEWRLGGGKPPVDFGTSVPRSIDRRLPPDADNWGMAQYLADL